MAFAKLSALVGGQFTVHSVGAYKWKMWDQQEGKMLSSDTYIKDYRKVYPVETEHGTLDLGSGQLGSLLAEVLDGGRADLIGKTFAVKSNGKTGMDIRYFFNAVSDPTPADKTPQTASQSLTGLSEADIQDYF